MNVNIQRYNQKATENKKKSKFYMSRQPKVANWSKLSIRGKLKLQIWSNLIFAEIK